MQCIRKRMQSHQYLCRGSQRRRVQYTSVAPPLLLASTCNHGVWNYTHASEGKLLHKFLPSHPILGEQGLSWGMLTNQHFANITGNKNTYQTHDHQPGWAIPCVHQSHCVPGPLCSVLCVCTLTLSMGLVQNRTGTQWDGYMTGLGCNGTGTWQDWDATGLGHTGPGTQWDRDTLGLGHKRPGTQWDWDTMGKPHPDPTKHQYNHSL